MRTCNQAKFFLQFATCLLVSIGTANLDAQEGKDSKHTGSEGIGFEKNDLSKNADRFRDALTLKTDAKNRMVIDREIWNRNAKTKEERIAEYKKRFGGARGIDDERITEMAERMAERDQSPLMDTIETCIDGITGGRGSSFSGSTRSKQWRTGPLNIRVSNMNPNNEIAISETKNDANYLLVYESEDELRAVFNGPQVMWQMHQREDGKLLVSMFLGNEPIMMSGEGLPGLLKNHPEQGPRFLKMLHHVGFETPLLPDDSEVVAEVINQITVLQGSADESFLTLLNKLDSNEFETREAATNRLKEKFSKFRILAQKHINEKIGSIQQRSTLQSMLSEFESSDSYNRVVKFVRESKLISNPKYVVNLLDNADDSTKVLLLERLKELTKQDFGFDIQKWKDFVNK